MSEIDLESATEILKHLQDPALSDRERQISAREPALGSGEVFDLALESAVLTLRYSLNRQTFEYLRWKVIAARETMLATLARIEAGRAERNGKQDPVSRSFIDQEWRRWTVTEIKASECLSQGRRCLIFESDDSLRRVWDFPADWLDLDSPALERLSWNR